MKMEGYGILIILLSWLSISTTIAQVNIRTVCQLPQVLVESSGLYIPSSDSIWSHGDSGNPNELYLIDSTGKLKRTVQVRDATNIDWEELAADSKGNLYIGDFGNNNNSRRDLLIYKVANFRALRTDIVVAKAIHFSYEDQKAFPPPLSNYVYDAEAMLVFEDSIFIVTKDYHAVPYQGISRIYRIPNIVGTHIATFVAQVKTDPLEKNYGGITGMAMSADGKRVVLISHYKVFLAEGFTGRSFWTVPWKSTVVNPIGSKEAVAFVDSCQLYLTEDVGSGTPGKLYLLDLCRWQPYISATKEVSAFVATCSPNPSVWGDDVTIFFKEPLKNETELHLYNMLGQEKIRIKIEKGAENVLIQSSILRGSTLWIAQLKGSVNSVKIIRL
jgi:hypothetical protein